MWSKFKQKIRFYRHILKYWQEQTASWVLDFLVKQMFFWDLKRKNLLQRIKNFSFETKESIKKTRFWNKWLLLKKKKKIDINIKAYLKKIFYYGPRSVIFIRQEELAWYNFKSEFLKEWFGIFFGKQLSRDLYLFGTLKPAKRYFKILFVNFIICNFFPLGLFYMFTSNVGGFPTLLCFYFFLSLYAKFWFGWFGGMFLFIVSKYGGVGLNKRQSIENAKQRPFLLKVTCALLGLCLFWILYRLPGAFQVMDLFGFDIKGHLKGLVEPFVRLFSELRSFFSNFSKPKVEKKPFSFSDKSTWTKAWKEHMDFYIKDLNEKELEEWQKYWENKTEVTSFWDYKWDFRWNISKSRIQVMDEAFDKRLQDEGRQRLEKFANDLLNDEENTMLKYDGWCKIINRMRKDLLKAAWKKNEEDLLKQIELHPSKKKKLWELIFGKK